MCGTRGDWKSGGKRGSGRRAGQIHSSTRVIDSLSSLKPLLEIIYESDYTALQILITGGASYESGQRERERARGGRGCSEKGLTVCSLCGRELTLVIGSPSPSAHLRLMNVCSGDRDAGESISPSSPPAAPVVRLFFPPLIKTKSSGSKSKEGETQGLGEQNSENTKRQPRDTDVVRPFVRLPKDRTGPQRLANRLIKMSGTSSDAG